MRRFACLWVIMLLAVQLFGQRYTLRIVENTTSPDGVIDATSKSQQFKSAVARTKFVNDLLIDLRKQGYAAARIDSTIADSLQQTVFISPGVSYQWAQIRKGNVDENILNETGFRERNWSNKPLRMEEAVRQQEKILVWCENHGFPFATIQLDSVQEVSPGNIAAALVLHKNRRVLFDSIEIKGNAKISKNFIQNYIQVRPGDVYNESVVRQISKRLRELNFLKESKPFEIIFTEKYTKLTLYLDKKPAGQFDGIVGMLPDAVTGKILFTGDANLRLYNSIGKGEHFALNWRRLREQTQDLKVRVTYPYLLRTPLGIDYGIKLYRRDTTFIDVNQSFGLQYLFSGNNSVKAFVNRRSATLLSAASFANATTLPPFADIRTTSYGLGWNLMNFDYRFNPRSGGQLNIMADAGNRIIERNARLNPIVYENVALRSIQYSSELLMEYFIPLFKRSALRAGFQGAWLYNNTMLFRNELFRIGGLKSIRGFDEESIFASVYTIGTIEYRLLLEENSTLFLFSDVAWYENTMKDEYVTDTPYSFGAGINFQVKGGIFNLTYALGNQFNQGIQLRSGKIHVGFIGLF